MSFSSLDEMERFEASRRHAERVMMSAFAVPAELLRPHVGAIEAAQQQEAVWRGYADWLGVAVRELTREQMEMATRTVERQALAAANAADSMRRLVLAVEQLRMEILGRRCQMVTAVVLIVVYLLVWMGMR